MPCTNCGWANAPDATYCEQCGHKLEFVCPTCNTPTGAGARFCKACGARLAFPHTDPDCANSRWAPSYGSPWPDSQNAGERKILTALFADLEGSTELIRDLDPESARAIVDPALKIMGNAVRQYGGYVAQSTGDGIFALFGAPLAEEDHAQRALYAALWMQQQLRQYSNRLAAENRPRLEARIGVHTGEVVMRSVEAGGRVEYLPVGYAANLAARMQAVAPAGGIAISEETRRLVEGYFELKDRGPTDVKGAAERINVYDVTGLGRLRTRFDLSTHRGLTPFVGRARELRQIHESFELARQGKGQLLALVGEAGTGKSRLLYEFKRGLSAGCRVWQGHSVAHHKGLAYQPVLELLHNYFAIDQSDNNESRRLKVASRLNTLDPTLCDSLPFLFALLGIQRIPDPIAEIGPTVRRARTLEAVKRIVVAESSNQPTILIIEDLHWIDPETQAMLDFLAEGIADARVMLVVSYRPEYRHKWSGKSYYSEIRLDRLSRENAGAMLDALLGRAVELDHLKRLIDERTEGNPLFIEETVRALFDEGALVRVSHPHSASDGDHRPGVEPALTEVRVTRPLSELRLPATVQGILAARIDRLRPEHKQLLQTLAVIGRESPLDLIREIAQQTPEQLSRMLRDLQTSEFVYQQLQPVSLSYRFKHVRTREVAYLSLLIDQRRQIHERVAETIESLYSGHLEDHFAELAHHYSRAGNVRNAVKYMGLSAKREIAMSAYDSALRQLTTARELLSQLSPGRERDQLELDLLVDYGVTLLVLRGFYVPELGEVYQRAASLCKQLGEYQRLMPVLFGLSSFHLCRAELKLARRHIEEMRALPIESKNVLTILTGWLLGNAQFFMGEFTNAHREFEHAIAAYDRTMHRGLAVQSGQDPCVSSLIYDAMALLIMGFADQAEKRVSEALSLAKELNHPFTLVVCLMTIANYLCIRRDFNRLAPVVAEAAELATEHGFAFYQEGVKAFEIIGLAFQGRVAELRAKSRVSTRFSELRYELALTWAQSTLAEAFAQLGFITRANSLLTDAMAKMNRNDERFVEAEILRIRGLLHIWQLPDSMTAEDKLKAQKEAEVAFRQAYTIALQQGAKLFALRASKALAKLLAGSPRQAEGAAMLDQCLSRFTEGYDCPDIVEARVLLDGLLRSTTTAPSAFVR